MSNTKLVLALLAAATAALPLTAQQKRVSPHETISTVIGDRSTGYRITITYGRPYTKDPRSGEPRKIWGELVPWDEAYRLGADEATLMITQQPIVMGSVTIPAGAHTLYLIPSASGTSKLGISNDVGAWGEPVDDSHDLARVDAKKEALEKPVDQLTLAIEKDQAGGGTLRIMWENTQFSVAFTSPGPHVDFPAASPTATYKQRVGVTDVEIVYSRPSMRSRTIFGGLVPYGEVWRTGANSATRFTFSTPVTLQGTHLDAGTYEVFSIPGKDEWTVILQKASKQWGAYTYNEKNDVARVTTKPVSVAAPVETFSIGLADVRDDSATLYLMWEQTRVPLKLEVDVTTTLVPQIEAVMSGSGKNKPYAQAAIFYGDHNLDLKKAVQWMDAAIAEHPEAYYFNYHKALILAKMGDKDGALAEAKKSIDMASKDQEPAKSEYIRLNEALIASLK
jgi:hypothetical protein